MARGPYQGTWLGDVRPTVVVAPDAILLVNGKSYILTCGECRRKFNFNKYLTSIQVDLSVDSAPGSASVSLSIPRHSVDDFFFEGEPIITPMMEVEIYAKGYYLVEGVPQYYPIFWGMVSEVTDSYSGGAHTFSISCSDILRWWEICTMNVTPAFTQQGGQLGRDYTHGTLFNTNVYDMIWTLAQQSFGDVVQATGSLTSYMREKLSPRTFARVHASLMQYWTERFSRMRSSLLLYGVRGAAVRGDSLYEAQRSGIGAPTGKWASTAIRMANGDAQSGQLYFDPENVVPFRQSISESGSPNLWQSAYQSKLELANVCKDAVGFEFYMDVTGDIVFKPPFYNLDVIGNKPVSWIQDIDIIDWSFSETESEVYTHLQMQGSADGGSMDLGVTSDFNTPYTQVVDYHLAKTYGWRTQTYNAEYLRDPQAMFYLGLDMLDKINSKRHRGSVTIPFRPELRLGFPVYLAPKDQVWYLSGISHSIQMGSSAQTQLTLTAKRSKFIAPKGIGSIESARTTSTSSSGTDIGRSGNFKVNLGTAAKIPPINLDTSVGVDDDPYSLLIVRHPKTGRIMGYPNVVLAYTGDSDERDLNATSADGSLQAALGQKQGTDRGTAKSVPNTTASPARSQNLQILKDTLLPNSDKDLATKHLDGRYLYGMTSAGTYTYLDDRDKIIQDLTQLPASKLDVSYGSTTVNSQSLFGGQAFIRPVSDERGFEVVGHYRYGRGTSLRDGSLVLSEGGGANTKAIISTQLALSGGLFDLLQAQSAGLTTITSGYASPANTVSKMTPDDLQTAAKLTPEKEVVFDVNGDQFVNVAPLGSPENVGLPLNAEASQLSNAITLAEMVPDIGTAIDEKAANCLCTTGRPDLAFLNVGYQLKSMFGSADPETVDSGVTLATTLAQSDLNRVTSELETAQKSQGEVTAKIEALLTAVAKEHMDPIDDPDDPKYNKYDSDLRDLRAEAKAWLLRVDALEKQQAKLVETVALDEPGTSIVGDFEVRPIIGGRFQAGTTSEFMNRAENFLANLYKTLDGPHKDHEAVLRGSRTLSVTKEESALGSTFQSEDSYGAFSPPYSPISRSRGGDPAVLAEQGASALASLSKSWKDVGQDLRNDPKKATLTSQISDLERDIAQMREDEARLISIPKGSRLVGPDGDVRIRLEKVQSNLVAAQKRLSQYKLELGILTND